MSETKTLRDELFMMLFNARMNPEYIKMLSKEDQSQDPKSIIDNAFRAVDYILSCRAPQKSEREKLLEMRIDELELPVRTVNTLIYGDIKTIGDLMCLRANEIVKISNLGRMSYLRIVEALAKLGLELPK